MRYRFVPQLPDHEADGAEPLLAWRDDSALKDGATGELWILHDDGTKTVLACRFMSSPTKREQSPT